jgi:Flp pilus assembly pilin Flp
MMILTAVRAASNVLAERFIKGSLPGQGIAEYGLILVLVAVVVIVAIGVFGGQTNSLIGRTVGSLS